MIKIFLFLNLVYISALIYFLCHVCNGIWHTDKYSHLNFFCIYGQYLPILDF